MPGVEDYFLLTERVFCLPPPAQEASTDIQARNIFLLRLYGQSIIARFNNKNSSDPFFLQLEKLFEKFYLLCNKYNALEYSNYVGTPREIVEKFTQNNLATSEYFEKVKKTFEKLLYYFSETPRFSSKTIAGQLNFIRTKLFSGTCNTGTTSAILVIEQELFSSQGDILTQSLVTLRSNVLHTINQKISENNNLYQNGMEVHSLGILAKVAHEYELNIYDIDPDNTSNDTHHDDDCLKNLNLPTLLKEEFFNLFTYGNIVDFVSENYAASILAHSEKEFSTDTFNDLKKTLQPFIDAKIFDLDMLHTLLDENYTLDTFQIRYLINAKTGAQIKKGTKISNDIAVKTEIHPQLREWCRKLLIAEGYLMADEYPFLVPITSSKAMEDRKQKNNLLHYILDNYPSLFSNVIDYWDVEKIFIMLFEENKDSLTPIEQLYTYYVKHNVSYPEKIKTWLEKNINLPLILLALNFPKKSKNVFRNTILSETYLSVDKLLELSWWNTEGASPFILNSGDIITSFVKKYLILSKSGHVNDVLKSFMQLTFFNEITENEFLQDLKKRFIFIHANDEQHYLPEIVTLIKKILDLKGSDIFHSTLLVEDFELSPSFSEGNFWHHYLNRNYNIDPILFCADKETVALALFSSPNTYTKTPVQILLNPENHIQYEKVKTWCSKNSTHETNILDFVLNQLEKRTLYPLLYFKDRYARKVLALLWALHKRTTPNFLNQLSVAMENFLNENNETELESNGAKQLYSACLDFLLTPHSTEAQLAEAITCILAEREIRISGTLRSIGLAPNKLTNKLHVAFRLALHSYYKETSVLGANPPTSFIQYRNTWRIHPNDNCDNAWALLLERIRYIKEVNSGYGSKLEKWLFASNDVANVPAELKIWANKLPSPSFLTTWWSDRQYRDLVRLAQMCTYKPANQETLEAYLHFIDQQEASETARANYLKY